MGDRHGRDEVLLDAGVERGLDPPDPGHQALDFAPRALVQERDEGAGAVAG